MKIPMKKVTTLAILSALAFVIMFVGRVPIFAVPPLKYDPKDIVITIGGFIFGPLAALLMSILVSAMEMLTVSSTGYIGLAMNIISTGAFACTAAAIYKKNRTIKGAIIGLVSGALLATGVMILWNYLLTPVFYKMDRSVVVSWFIPVILPFNLLKNALNAAAIMLIYKPVTKALQGAKLLPQATAQKAASKRLTLGVLLLSLFVITTCVLLFLAITGEI